YLQLDGDWCRQRTDLNRSASRIWFAAPGKVFRVDAVVDWKIFFHVGQKHGDIDDVLPCRARVFEDESDIFKHGAAFRFDVVADDVSSGIECDAGNFLAAARTRPDPREKEQIADPFRVRKRANRL